MGYYIIVAGRTTLELFFSSYPHFNSLLPLWRPSLAGGLQAFVVFRAIPAFCGREEQAKRKSKKRKKGLDIFVRTGYNI